MLKEDINKYRKMNTRIKNLNEREADLRHSLRYSYRWDGMMDAGRSYSHEDKMADGIAKIAKLEEAKAKLLIESSYLYIDITDVIDRARLTSDSKSAVMFFVDGKRYKDIAKTMHDKTEAISCRVRRCIRYIDSGKYLDSEEIEDDID